MSEEGLNFRATKDIELVLIVEALNANFGSKFLDFVKTAGYEHRNKSTSDPQFYRFSHPKSKDYPIMIELFTKKPNAVILPENAQLSPLPLDEDVSSLSAILLDDAYYHFLKQDGFFDCFSKDWKPLYIKKYNSFTTEFEFFQPIPNLQAAISHRQ